MSTVMQFSSVQFSTCRSRCIRAVTDTVLWTGCMQCACLSNHRRLSVCLSAVSSWSLGAGDVCSWTIRHGITQTTVSQASIIPRLHDEAGSTSWFDERSSSARRAHIKHASSTHQAHTKLSSRNIYMYYGLTGPAGSRIGLPPS